MEIEIFDDFVPLSATPEEEETLPEELVLEEAPVDAQPYTGDSTVFWLILMALSGTALVCSLGYGLYDRFHTKYLR
jgi:hypothetical protein